MNRGRAPQAVLLIACLLVAGCGGGSGADGGAATIEFVVFGEPEELQAFRDIAAAFESEQDAIDVALIEAADRQDLLTRVSTSMAAGTPPDLFLVNYRFYGQFAARDSLEPVDHRLAASERLAAADFYPEAMEAFQWHGEQMCLPQNVSSLAVYYNGDLFAAAGLGEPADDWTWDDMVTAAGQLTRDADGDGTIETYGLGVEPTIVRLAPFVWSSGGDLFDDPESPTGYAIDTPAELIAVQDFIDLRAQQRVIPTDEETEAEDLESRFLNGRLGMLMDSRRVVPVLRSIEAFEWDVAPLPAREERLNVLHSDAYCMTSGSDHHGAAWSFMEFALGPDGQRIAAATGRTVPSLRQVAESGDFLDPDSAPSRSQVFLDAIPGIRRLPSLSTWPEIEDLSNALVEEAVFEPAGGEAIELVQNLAAETAPLFDRAER